MAALDAWCTSGFIDDVIFAHRGRHATVYIITAFTVIVNPWFSCSVVIACLCCTFSAILRRITFTMYVVCISVRADLRLKRILCFLLRRWLLSDHDSCNIITRAGSIYYRNRTPNWLYGNVMTCRPNCIIILSHWKRDKEFRILLGEFFGAQHLLSLFPCVQLRPLLLLSRCCLCISRLLCLL